MTYVERGYLTDDYHRFCLRDTVSLEEIDYHFHTFHKLLLFRGGNAGYVIEGQHVPLRPGDVILVPKGCVHKPETESQIPYARDIYYLDDGFLRREGLESVFRTAAERRSYVVRPDPAVSEEALRLSAAIADAEAEPEAFAARKLCRLLVCRLLILVGRELLDTQAAPPAVFNELMLRILADIRENLTGDVSADSLAGRFYISKYHLMRMFREETGTSLHRYVTDKRLLLAREFLLDGLTATEACYRCGYRDYSAFAKAYKKQFGIPPGKDGMPKGSSY